jgi:hypothetical protein
METSTLSTYGNKLVSIARKDEKIKLSWRLEHSNRYQIERAVHISNTIIIIALFTKSLKAMTSVYSSKNNAMTAMTRQILQGQGTAGTTLLTMTTFSLTVTNKENDSQM